MNKDEFIFCLQKELRAQRPDGTIVTETRHSTEQERVCDEELPEGEVFILTYSESLVFDLIMRFRDFIQED